VSKAGVEAASAWWSQTLPFEATWSIFSTAQEKGMAMANSALKDIAEEYNDVADKVQLFQEEINKIVEHATELKQQLLESNIDLVVLHDYMTQEVANIVEKLQKEFDKPLPDDKDERARHRGNMISKILDALEAAFVHVCVKSGRMSEEDARQKFRPVKTAIHDAFLIAGMF
jgi:septal ring factor EnvC (AmiA/AmiB activator)